MENYKLSAVETSSIIINLLCAKFFLSAPRYFTEISGGASWITIIFIFLIAIIFITAFFKLAKNRKGLDILDMLEASNRPALRSILGCICVLALLLICSVTLRQFTEGIQTISLPRSPLYFSGLLLAIGMIIGAYSGLKAISKTHGFFVPLIFIIVVIFMLMLSAQFDLTAFTPILGPGAKAVFGTGFFTLSTLFELIVLFFLPPLLKDEKNFRKITIASYIISFLLFLMIASAFIITVPHPDSLDNFLPIFQMIRLINFGSFFQRLESVFFIIFTISALLHLSAMLFFLTHIFAKTFNLPYKKPLIIPLGILVSSLATINFHSETAVVILNQMGSFLWLVPFAIPIISALPKRSKK